MTRNQELTALAHEFSDKFEVNLRTTPDEGYLMLESRWLEIASIDYRPGSINLTIWDYSGDYESWRFTTFEDTPQEWQRAKLAFREAAFAEMKRSTE